MLTPLFAGLLLPAMSLASLLRRDMQLHESRAEPPSGYTVLGLAAPETILTLRLAIVQNNLTALIDTLYEVSNPSSPNYGAYLSKEEVLRLHFLRAYDDDDDVCRSALTSHQQTKVCWPLAHGSMRTE